MGRRATSGPTEAELEILTVLWELGPSTVRQVNQAINSKRPTGKTTTLKLMQIMVDKGLLVRDESVRPQLYRPTASKRQVQGKLLGNLLDRAFDGSASALVVHLLEQGNVSVDELDEIRKTIAAHRRKRGDK